MKKCILLSIGLYLQICGAVSAQSNVFPTPSGNVGIGTSSPQSLLHLEGPLNSNRITFSAPGYQIKPNITLQTPIGAGVDLGINGMDRLILNPGYSVTFNTAIVEWLNGFNWDIMAGKTGLINTETLTFKVKVTGDTIFSYKFDQDTILRPASGHNIQLAPDGGRVGVGTNNPSGKLTVSGVGGSAGGDGIEWFSAGNSSGYLGWVGRIFSGAPTGGWATAPFIFSVPDGSGSQIDTMVLINGKVGIGTMSPTQKLSVNGVIRAKEVIVDTGWSDYVFSKDYRLKSLNEVEKHIMSEGHLPDIPSSKEVTEHGISVGEMQSKLLAKVEELTLYMINLEKKNAALQARVSELERANSTK